MISVSNNNSIKKDIDWIDREFIPFEELFEDFGFKKQFLFNFVNDANGIEAKIYTNGDKLNISVDIKGVDVFTIDFDEMLDNLFPEKEQILIKEIISNYIFYNR